MIGPTLDYFQQRYANPRVHVLYSSIKRTQLYRRVAALVASLQVTYVLDIGCSIGGLVDLLNHQGMDAWGLDLEIPQIRNAHSLLACKDKFYYGDISNVPTLPESSAVILLDTLRYLPLPHAVADLGSQFIVVKEVASGLLGMYLRRNQFQVALYSPRNVCKLFPGYRVYALYGPKFLFTLPVLALANLVPSYTLILEKATAGNSGLQNESATASQHLLRLCVHARRFVNRRAHVAKIDNCTQRRKCVV